MKKIIVSVLILILLVMILVLCKGNVANEIVSPTENIVENIIVERNYENREATDLPENFVG